MPTIKQVQLAVCNYYNLPTISMVSQRRSQVFARPRQIAMFLASELTPASLKGIGQQFERDHTTILHGIRKIAALSNSDLELVNDLKAIRGLIQTRGDTFAAEQKA